MSPPVGLLKQRSRGRFRLKRLSAKQLEACSVTELYQAHLGASWELLGI